MLYWENGNDISFVVRSYLLEMVMWVLGKIDDEGLGVVLSESLFCSLDWFVIFDVVMGESEKSISYFIDWVMF